MQISKMEGTNTGPICSHARLEHVFAEQVMLEHKDWRERIFEAAMVLFQAKTGKEPDLEQFVWALLHLSHVVSARCSG